MHLTSSISISASSQPENEFDGETADFDGDNLVDLDGNNELGLASLEGEVELVCFDGEILLIGFKGIKLSAIINGIYLSTSNGTFSKYFFHYNFV